MRARPREAETGFGLVELVVVLFITIVLMAAVVSKMGGARKATHYRVATSSAIAYAEAVEAYMADNGQVPPALGSAGWPTGSRADRIRGPLNVMLVEGGRPKPYVTKSTPEPVQDGIVDIGASRASAAPDTRAFITYTVTGSEYRFLVETIPASSGDAVLRCVVTNAATTPAGVERCE